MSRVDMENLMQDYEDKLYDQKVGVAPAADSPTNAEGPANSGGETPGSSSGKPPG